jgi:3-oxoadipate enol-lactonase
VPTVDVNGFTMYYRDTGGSMSPVIFIHGGFPSVATLWDKMVDDLEPWQLPIATCHRMINFLRRGYHPSACPSDGYGIDNQAADAIVLLDYLGLESAHVIGSSAGGPVSYCLAARFPARVRSLVLVGTGLNLRRTLRDRPGVVGMLTEQIEVLHQLGAEAASTHRPPQWTVSFDPLFMADEYTERGDRDEYQYRLAQQEEQLSDLPIEVRARFHAAELRAIEAYLSWDGRHEAASVRCPTLVVHGRRDRAISVEEGAELAALIPRAQFETFPASHSLLWRHEPALTRTLEFITTIEEERVP